MGVASTASEPADPAQLDRILTIPNVLSVGRIVLLGVFVYLLFESGDRIAATVVLMAVGITDFLDGYIARRFHQVSTLGKVLDPLADRLVLATAVISIVVYGAVPAWLAIVVLGRELLVSVAVAVLAGMGARRIDVSWVGKAATFGLLCCFPLFLLGDQHGTWARVLTTVTWVAIVPALVLSFVAAAAYLPVARRALTESRTPPASPDEALVEGRWGR